jgi:hypothetical protein
MAEGTLPRGVNQTEEVLPMLVSVSVIRSGRLRVKGVLEQ